MKKEGTESPTTSIPVFHMFKKNYFFENAISTRNSRSQHEHNFFSDSKTIFLLPPFEDCFAEE